MTTVGVVGGGIAGLTVADELSRRGLEVHVFESHPTLLGGKARSHHHQPSGWGPLPAEHGFRFFPGFYTNVIATMADIPRGDGGSVADRLTNAKELRYSFAGAYAGCAVSSTSWENAVESLAEKIRRLARPSAAPAPKLLDLPDVAYLLELFRYLHSADRDRLLSLESWSFSEFTLEVFPGLTTLQWPPSERLKTFLGSAGTRLLVAAQPTKMSARTGLITLARILDPIDIATERVDRLLQGPTNDEWIDPWAAALTSAGDRVPVIFHMGNRVTALEFTGDVVDGFTTSPGGASHSFDHVVLALPHAETEKLLAPHQAILPAPLNGMAALHSDWMVGAQYYLSSRPDICEGHVMYIDSPWALTSICQGQFWPDFDWGAAGDGSVTDVLSVCISDWDAPGELFGKPAKQCTVDEIRDEVWHQMHSSLNDVERHDLPEDQSSIVRAFALDPGLHTAADGQITGNDTPLFINTVGSWHDRPPADVGLPNLFLAGDWVRTNADLATMESANESGRRAADAILGREGLAPDVPVHLIDDKGLL